VAVGAPLAVHLVDDHVQLHGQVQRQRSTLVGQRRHRNSPAISLAADDLALRNPDLV